jgi:hypothetical protein
MAVHPSPSKPIQAHPSPSKPIQAHPSPSTRIQAHSSGHNPACEASGHQRWSAVDQAARPANQIGDTEMGNRGLGDRGLRNRGLGDRRLGDTKLGDRGLTKLGIQVMAMEKGQALAWQRRGGSGRWQAPQAPLGACTPQLKRYIYRSCSRIILKGCSPIDTIKTAPNHRFGGFFGLQTPSAAF